MIIEKLEKGRGGSISPPTVTDDPAAAAAGISSGNRPHDPQPICNLKIPKRRPNALALPSSKMTAISNLRSNPFKSPDKTAAPSSLLATTPGYVHHHQQQQQQRGITRLSYSPVPGGSEYFDELTSSVATSPQELLPVAATAAGSPGLQSTAVGEPGALEGCTLIGRLSSSPKAGPSLRLLPPVSISPHPNALNKQQSPHELNHGLVGVVNHLHGGLSHTNNLSPNLISDPSTVSVTGSMSRASEGDAPSTDSKFWISSSGRAWEKAEPSNKLSRTFRLGALQQYPPRSVELPAGFNRDKVSIKDEHSSLNDTLPGNACTDCQAMHSTENDLTVKHKVEEINERTKAKVDYIRMQHA